MTPVSKPKCQRTAPNAHENFIVERGKKVKEKESDSKTTYSARI